MKKLISVSLIFFLCLTANSQILTPINGYGQKHLRLQIDTFLKPPADTVYNAPVNSLAVKNGIVYIRKASKWEAYASASTPSLQQVTSIDSVTTNSIWIKNGNYPNGGLKIGKQVGDTTQPNIILQNTLSNGDDNAYLLFGRNGHSKQFVFQDLAQTDLFYLNNFANEHSFVVPSISSHLQDIGLFADIANNKSYLQLSGYDYLGKVKSDSISGSDKDYFLPNESGTLALRSDVSGVSRTLQQVLTAGSTLTTDAEIDVNTYSWSILNANQIVNEFSDAFLVKYNNSDDCIEAKNTAIRIGKLAETHLIIDENNGEIKQTTNGNYVVHNTSLVNGDVTQNYPDASGVYALSLNGNGASSTGDLTEEDPIYAASSWYGTTNNSTNWNTAYTNRITSATSPLRIASNVISVDTGRSANVVATGGGLKKVTDSLADLIAAKGTVASVAATNGLGISTSVANSTTNPNITIAVDTGSTSILSRQRAASTYQGALNGTGLVYSTSGIPSYKTFNSNNEQTYSSTITFTGTTPPSGTTNHTFRFTRVDNIVFFRLNMSYSVAASGITQVQFPIPTEMPTPESITDFSTGSTLQTPLRCNGGNTKTIVNPLSANISYNSGTPIIQINCASQNLQYAQIQGFYFTNN